MIRRSQKERASGYGRYRPTVYLGGDYCTTCALQEMYCTCIFSPQSGNAEANIVTPSTNMTVQNVKFSDQKSNASYAVKSYTDPTRKLQDGNSLSLSDFFSRPVVIAREEWVTGGIFDVRINPWRELFSNTKALNRITNYKLMRADLKIKVVINGNGFQYGRAICAYQPLADYDHLSRTSVLYNANMIQVSQFPHIFLDPCTSTGGEMTLPFFWYKNYCDVPNKEWEGLGDLLIQPFGMLKHANGAVDKATITVFAWAENVQLSGLTSNDSDELGPQSGEEVSEANVKGFISGPAGTIARAATALSAIPEIAPFAMATASVANGVAGAAKIFGLSRPAHTVDNMPAKLKTVSELSTTTTPDCVSKLTVDDKQELTIDPRISGINGDDPLSIVSIAKRESYITRFSWPMGTSEGSLLWNCRVTPMIWDTSETDLCHFPAVAAAALPFKYWTGTLNYRFQFVCSAFHKGRVRIVYDPDRQEANAHFSTNYMEIVDLADKNDFTISISNSQENTLLFSHRPGQSVPSQIFSTTRYTNVSSINNGILSVEVLNELTTPNSEIDNSISINVFVSAGDDFEVFVPDNWWQNFNMATGVPSGGEGQAIESEKFEAQSGTEQGIDSHNTAEPSAPLQDITDNIAVSPHETPLINKVFTGESIISFRQLLKRYYLHHRLGGFPDVDNYLVIYNTPTMPAFRGYYDGATGTTANGDPYSFVNTVMIHYVVSMFQGWRGSIRRKIIPSGFTKCDSTATVTTNHGMVERHVMGQGMGGHYYTWIPQTTESVNELARDAMLSTTNSSAINVTGANGAAVQCFDYSPAMEVESPFYSHQRFYPGKHANYTNLVDQEKLRFVGHYSANPHTVTDIWTAAGEDFQVYFFTGMPPMRFEISPPLSQ